MNFSHCDLQLDLSRVIRSDMLPRSLNGSDVCGGIRMLKG